MCGLIYLHSTKRGDEEKSAIQEENCNTFKVGHRPIEVAKSLASSGATRWTRDEDRSGLGASDSRQGRYDVCIAQIKSGE